MSKQLTLFGTRAVAKSFIVYRDPNGDYECFIERYCLRAKKTRGQINNQRIHVQAQNEWKNVYKGNQEKIQEYLVLQGNEKPFVR
jgi:hypothetical protein